MTADRDRSAAARKGVAGFNSLSTLDSPAVDIGNDAYQHAVKRFREELKLPILGWTIRTKEDIERAKEYCDGIIFENIENLRANMHILRTE